MIDHSAPLSTVIHNGYKIARYRGNRVEVSRLDHIEPTRKEAIEIARWFWLHAVEGNDPATT